MLYSPMLFPIFIPLFIFIFKISQNESDEITGALGSNNNLTRRKQFASFQSVVLLISRDRMHFDKNSPL